MKKTPKRNPPNRTNPVAQLSFPPLVHEKLDKLSIEMGLSKSAAAAFAITELFQKRVRQGIITT